jgi:hypothetical protein
MDENKNEWQSIFDKPIPVFDDPVDKIEPIDEEEDNVDTIKKMAPLLRRMMIILADCKSVEDHSVIATALSYAVCPDLYEGATIEDLAKRYGKTRCYMSAKILNIKRKLGISNQNNEEKNQKLKEAQLNSYEKRRNTK